MPAQNQRDKGQKRKASDSNALPPKTSAKPSAGLAVATCQVEGCLIDLSASREYHKRYRICEDHAVSKRVLVNGNLSRFCQQCGRFEDLSIFDSNKRSCRFSLQRHNLRRRRGTKAVTPTVVVPDTLPSPAAPAETGDTMNNNLHASSAQRTSERLGTRKRHRAAAVLGNPPTRSGPTVGRYEEGFAPRSAYTPPPLPVDFDGELLTSEDLSDFCPNMSMGEEDSFHLLRHSNPLVSNPQNNSSQFQQLFQAGEPSPNLSPPGTWADRNTHAQSVHTGHGARPATNPNYSAYQQNLFQTADLNSYLNADAHTWAGPTLLPPSPFPQFTDVPSPITQWAIEALRSNTPPPLPRTVSPAGAYQTNLQSGTGIPADWPLHSNQTPRPNQGSDFHLGAISQPIPSTSSPWPQHARGDTASTLHMEARILDAATSWGEHLSPQMQQRSARRAVLRAQLENCNSSMPVQSHSATNLSLRAPSPPLLPTLYGAQSIVATPTVSHTTFATPSPNFYASGMLSNSTIGGNGSVGSPLTQVATPRVLLPTHQLANPGPNFCTSGMLSTSTVVGNGGLGNPLTHVATPRVMLPDEQLRLPPSPYSAAGGHSLQWQEMVQPAEYQLPESPLRPRASSDQQAFQIPEDHSQAQEDFSQEQEDVEDPGEAMAGFDWWNLRAGSYNQPRERPVDLELLLRSLSDPSAYARANARRS